MSHGLRTSLPRADYAPMRWHSAGKARCGYCGKLNADKFHIEQCADDAARMAQVCAQQGGRRHGARCKK